MARETYVLRGGELVPKWQAAPLHEAGAAPNIIRDGMDSTLNHADGRRYDSKRGFEKAVRAAGCEIMGNENPRPAPVARPAMRADMLATIRQLSDR